MARTPLSPDALREALSDLPHWRGDTSGLLREVRFGSYEAGVAFAMQVALVAPRLDRRRAIGLRRGLRLVDVREDAPRLFEVALPRVGEGHGAGAPLEEADAEVIFESRGGGRIPGAMQEAPWHRRRGTRSTLRSPTR